MLELVAEEIAEEVMVSEAFAPVVQRHQQEVLVLERLEPRSRAHDLKCGVTERSGHLVQDRGSHQEGDLILGEVHEDVLTHVVRYEAIIPRERRFSISRRTGGARQSGEVQTNGPALRLFGESRDFVSGEVGRTGASEQEIGIVDVEAEILRSQLEEITVHPGPCQGQRAEVSRRQYDLRTLGYLVDRREQELDRGMARQDMHVIDDEEQRVNSATHRRAQAGGDHGAFGVRGDELLHERVFDRHERRQCEGKGAGQRDRIVVLLRDR